MVLNNELKDYLPVGILCAICTLVVELLFEGTFSIVLVVFTGASITLSLYLLNKLRTNKAQAVYDELSKTQKIVCRGIAAHNGKGAYLYLTEDSILIYLDKIAIDGEKSEIALKDVMGLSERNNNTLTLNVLNESFEFSVRKATVWKKMIQEQIAALPSEAIE